MRSQHCSEQDVARAILAARPTVPRGFVDDVMAALPGTHHRTRGTTLGIAVVLGAAVAVASALALITLPGSDDRIAAPPPSLSAGSAPKSLETQAAELVTEIEPMLDAPVPNADSLIEKLERLEQLRAQLPLPPAPSTLAEQRQAIEEAARQIEWNTRVQKALLRAQ